ncbi:protein translocase subunit SecF [Candidatus Parcubacteria bacterium]|nr:protein translocase subunit SecF [Candidatus Parcubacteria bacterium]
MIKIIQKRNIWLSFSGVLVAVSIIALAVFGLNLGIDFTGGSLLELKFLNERPAVNDIQQSVADLELGSLVVQPVDEQNVILRFQETSEEKHQEVLKRLDQIGMETEAEEAIKEETSGFKNIEELRFDSVGPTIGQELKSKSVSAAIIVLIAIVLYIAWIFRKVSKPVESWKYGVSAIIALFHDLIITLGIFACLGHYMNVELNTAFVAAMLMILGYSVNDTIVVFDRIRENLPKSEEDFEGTVNTSVNQTIKRSINTSFTTLLVLLSIFFFGGATIRDFVLALSFGVLIGTYSSIFLASPVLVLWERFGRK